MSLSNVQFLHEILDFTCTDRSPDILSWLSQKQMSHDDIIQFLFSASSYALKEGMTESGKILLNILINQVDDEEKKNLINALLGSLYFKEGNLNTARKYYSRLPLNEANLSRYLLTYTEQNDLEGIFDYKDKILFNKLDTSLLKTIENTIQEVIDKNANNSNIIEQHFLNYKTNLNYIKQIDPDIYNDLIAIGFPKLFFRFGINLNNNKLYINSKDGWQRSQGIILTGKYRYDKCFSNFTETMAIRCTSIKDIIEFLGGLHTDHRVFETPLFYLIIDLNLLNISLTLLDFSVMTKCDYVFRIINLADFEAHLARIVTMQNVFILPRQIQRNSEDNSFFNERLIPLVIKLTDEYEKRFETYKQKIKNFYSDDFYLTLPQKLEKKSLKILFLTSRYTTFLQHCTKDMADAFKKIGCRVEIRMEGDNDPPGGRMDILFKQICEFIPDIIFSIDHLRFGFQFSKNVPFVTWIQDLMQDIFELKETDCIGKLDYLYCSSSYWQKELSEKPAYRDKKIKLLPHLLNPGKYFPLHCPKKYDVTYVAHLHIPDLCNCAYMDVSDSSLSNNEIFYRYFIRYLELKPMNELTAYYSGNDKLRMELVKQFYNYIIGKINIGWDNLKIPHRALQSIIIMVLRFKPLKYLLDHNVKLRLFGNNWNKHPWFKDVAMGPVKNGMDLNTLINETKINLNINPAMSFHNKVPEVTGASAFFLTRDIGEYDLLPIDMFFKRDEEVVLFKDEKDLLDKILYYLEHDNEREEIAHRAHMKALKAFTFESGAEQILQDIISVK